MRANILKRDLFPYSVILFAKHYTEMNRGFVHISRHSTLSDRKRYDKLTTIKIINRI